MGIFNSKKGVSLFMSWVLLILVVISLGMGFYAWARSYAQSSTGRLVVNQEKSSCSSASLSLTNICQTASLVYVDIKNTGSVEVKGVLFSSLSLYDITNNVEVNQTIDVGKTHRFAVPKQGVIQLFYASPVIFSNGDTVKCPTTEVSTDKIPFCR